MSKRVTSAAAVLVAPAFVLVGCANQTTTSEETTSTAPNEQAITAELKSADGQPVANASIDFANGVATVTVETVGTGTLSPGFHGMHIHSVGKCEADSVAPSGGEPGDFKSAGGHLQVDGHQGTPASGDLPSLLVRSDGSARLVATTDAFTEDDLTGPQGSALMIHADPDNFGNIPDRYTHDGVPGPDAETLATGDAGGRVACAVLAPASATGTSASTSTSTSTVTETTSAPAPPAGTETTTTPSSPTSGTSETTSATTETTTSPETTSPSPAG